VGSHVYHKAATDAVRITLKDIFGETVIINSTASIAAAPLQQLAGSAPAGRPLTVKHGKTFTNLVIGSFRDDNATNTSAAEYVGTIDWGDGSSTSAARFVFTGATPNVGSNWKVKGTHKYASANAYTVTISIHQADNPGNVLLLTTTINAS
jgi:hypothetical protein